MITDTPERSLAAMLCSACELLAAAAEQTDIKVTVCHTGRMQLYDYGSEEFEADQMEPHRAAETLKSALEARPDGWVWPRPNAADETRRE